MKYQTKQIKVEAFMFGLEKYPPWFEQAIVESKVIICNNNKCQKAHIKNIGAERGDFIINRFDGIFSLKPNVFIKLYQPCKKGSLQ